MSLVKHRTQTLLLAAGRGTRMGPGLDRTNKLCLPYRGQTVLAHMLQRIPPSHEVLIALGHASEDVKKLAKSLSPRQSLRFVPVDLLEGPGSGPGYSALCAEPLLQEGFFLFCADTLWDQPLFDTDGNWLGLCAVSAGLQKDYLMVEMGADGEIVRLQDKPRTPMDGALAFTGAARIDDASSFFGGLRAARPLAELQLAEGFLPLIRQKKLKGNPMGSWQDIGTREKYGRLSLAADFPFFDSRVE